MKQKFFIAKIKNFINLKILFNNNLIRFKINLIYKNYLKIMIFLFKMTI